MNRHPRPMPYWYANTVYRRVGRARLKRQVPIPFACQFDVVRMVTVRRRVRSSAANVGRYGQGHRTPRPVLSMIPRSYLVRRHTFGAWG